MEPRRLSIYIGIPCYGGNGGSSSLHPNVAEWFAQTLLWAKGDPRIGEIHSRFLSDTPVTMVRNQFVMEARSVGADVMICCDSDQSPSFHADDPTFKPFVPSSFDYLYAHWDKGPVVIAAPYRGNPPQENMFVFHWEQTSGDYGDETSLKLEQYTRHQAAMMRGIQEIAAAPTGLIMYDMRAFELIEPCKLSKREVLDLVAQGKMTLNEAERNLSDGWFYYQWKDGYAMEKASTEDVTFTRDISMVGQAKLGYNPLLCNWDSPIGHHKFYCVPGRPKLLTVDQITGNFQRALQADRRAGVVQVDAKDYAKGWERQIASQHHNGNGKHCVHKTAQTHLDALKQLVESEWRARGGEQGEVPLEVCEVGSWHGDSAKAMASTGKCRVTCVDHFEGSDNLIALALREPPLEKFLANTKAEREAGTIDIHVERSVEAARKFTIEGRQFDVVFIDADKAETRADLIAWIPLVRVGGVMVVHDYLVDPFPEVTQAVHEVFGDKARPYAWSDRTGGFALIRKEPQACPTPA